MNSKLFLFLYLFLALTGFSQTRREEQFYFQSDSFNLKSNHMPGMNRLLDAMKINPYYRITMQGSADSIGVENYNYELSKKRIAAIRAEMLRNGIKVNRIKVDPKGEMRPAYDNGTEAGKQRNRRVDVKVLFDKDTIFRDGCAKTFIAKGTFDPYFTNEILIKFYPVTNYEQMQSNNVSAQTLDGNYLFSNGMMRITSTVNGIEVNPRKPVTIRIPAHKMDPLMEIYEGITAGTKPVNWKKLDIKFKKGYDDCAYFEVDGSFLNRWVNIDKPRPSQNTICQNNPFAWLDMPSIDNDSSKVIENDIILSFAKSDFNGISMDSIEVNTDKITTVCQLIENRITGKTMDENFLTRDQNILHLKGFTSGNKPVETSLKSFTAFFPLKKVSLQSEFFIARESDNEDLIWASAGKPDSIFEIKGCDCKYAVKTFDYPVSFINISKEETKTREPIMTRKLSFKKKAIEELFVYYSATKNLVVIKPNSSKKFEIPVLSNEAGIVIFGKYEQNGEIFFYDNRLEKIKKRWFKKERMVKPGAFSKMDPKKGLKLKSISCRKSG